MIVLAAILGIWIVLIIKAGIIGFFLESNHCLICFKKYSWTGVVINMLLMFLLPFAAVRWVWSKLRSWYSKR